MQIFVAILFPFISTPYPHSLFIKFYKNIIGAPKMRNNFWCTINCSFLRFWESNIWLFSIASHKVINYSSIFTIAKIIAFNLFSVFFQCCTLIDGSFALLLPIYVVILYSNCSLFCLPFKAIAKCDSKLFTIASFIKKR